MVKVLSTADFFSNKQLAFKLIQRDPQPDYPLHSHEFSELVIVYRGGGRHLIYGESRTIEAGDVFVIPAQTRHGYQEAADLALYNLMFDLHSVSNPLTEFCRDPAFRALFRLEPRLSGVGGLRLPPEELAEALRIVREIATEESRMATGAPMAMTAWFVLLIARLGRWYQDHARSPGSAPLLRLSKLIQQLGEHPERDWSRGEMARAAGMSVSTLTRHFKRHTGYAPLEYWLVQRLKRASLLLLNPECTIAEAARRTGFADSNYFCRQFRKHFGDSPGQWRRLPRPGAKGQ